ncbi:hypothetical protein CFOL_v3_01831 [Cephalotus follicularis]|uniref:UBN2 domain-containing protein n=1 Tax=Cephalotus follicularis TaxID=3775 RepID=A0A1Q3ARC2_CEPFO|nr:hypothetical protein CFOL_v3_01831 [Cephalotus follicularis]
MTSFIQSIDYDIWDIVVSGPELLKENVSNSRIRYDGNERDLLKLNAKVKHINFCSLSSNVFESISLCNSAKEIWEKLKDCYGTNSCLMALEESDNGSDEDDTSKSENEVSYDDFVEVVDRYTSIISSLKNKIKCLTIES